MIGRKGSCDHSADRPKPKNQIKPVLRTPSFLFLSLPWTLGLEESCGAEVDDEPTGSRPPPKVRPTFAKGVFWKAAS